MSAAPGSASRFAIPNGPPPLAPTSVIANAASATHVPSSGPDDDYRLEDMLLLRKNAAKGLTHLQPGASTSSGSPSSKIRCEYCSKTFKTKWTLSSHVAAHEGRFQYQCCICNKRFVRKSHYESHVRSHDAARPYVCEHCG